MSRRSLRLRLLLAAAMSVGLALVMAGLGLVALFDRHVERRVNVELHTFVTQIAGAIDFQPDGQPALSRALADPRFERPYGGLYWQIETDDHTKVRSRSSISIARSALSSSCWRSSSPRPPGRRSMSG